MNFVWNVDGVSVGSITMNRWNGMQMWTSGFAFCKDQVAQWEATATAQGWLVRITRSTGYVGEYQGVTFNLPLEVVTAIRRLA